MFNLNENLINVILKMIRDLFKIEQTSLEYRKQAFEYLILFYQKKVKSLKYEFQISKEFKKTLLYFKRVINSTHFS